MSEKVQVLIRQAEFEDLHAVVEIDSEAFSPYGTTEKPETFYLRWRIFQNGFIVLFRDGELVGYGCSEKWAMEREPALDQNPLDTHDEEGKIFCITAMAVRKKYRRNGYGLAILDELIKIARQEACTTILLETTHAQGLYEKRNFRTVRTRDERGIALDVMALDLK
jgi:ribosomal protein S18 acetylase RimI-like enzyme